MPALPVNWQVTTSPPPPKCPLMWEPSLELSRDKARWFTPSGTGITAARKPIGSTRWSCKIPALGLAALIPLPPRRHPPLPLPLPSPPLLLLRIHRRLHRPRLPRRRLPFHLLLRQPILLRP